MEWELEVKDKTEKEINVPEKLEEFGQKIVEFKDVVENELKDMEVDVRNWNFAARVIVKLIVSFGFWVQATPIQFFSQVF